MEPVLIKYLIEVILVAIISVVGWYVRSQGKQMDDLKSDLTARIREGEKRNNRIEEQHYEMKGKYVTHEVLREMEDRMMRGIHVLKDDMNEKFNLIIKLIDKK